MSKCTRLYINNSKIWQKIFHNFLEKWYQGALDTHKICCQIFELFICNLVHFDTSISKIILILRTFWPKLNKWRKTILAGNSTFNSGNFEKIFWDERIFLKIFMHEGQLAPSRAFDSCNKIHIDFGGFVISLTTR